MANKIKVLSIDDSALIRQLLTKIVNSDPDLEMVATAANPILAEAKLKTIKPDIITLDIEMPEMDGITYLKKLMINNPIPVIMFSSLLDKHRELALDALNIGAFDYVIKPSANVRDGVEELATLPPREVLVAQALGGLNAPIQGFANVLQGTIRGLVIALNQIAEKEQTA